MPEPDPSPDEEAGKGLLFGVAAYAWWGLAAIYFKAVGIVPPLEILAHRIAWSVVVLVLLVTITGRWRAIAAVIAAGKPLLFLLASTILIALNWYVFIWAISASRMVEASLGYFINPLVNVLFGFLFLGERLRTWEWVSVALAGVAVGWLTLGAGAFPWISLVLAVSFALYGLLRKLARVASIEGLTIETVLLLPLALGYLVMLDRGDRLAFGAHGWELSALLVAAGPITALPLLWFAAAVRRLRLATIGLLQYIAPTLQFMLAVLVYGEPFGGARVIAFALIWSAIALYSFENLKHHTSTRGR